MVKSCLANLNLPMDDATQLTAVILAGGQGRRMGGLDKGLLTWRGRPLVEHVLAALAPQVERVLISANRNLERYREYGHAVLPDAGTDSRGPLAGVLAALAHCRTDYLLTVPCDAPQIHRDFALRMLTPAIRQGAQAAVAHDGQRMQPVFSLLHRDLRAPLHDFLQRGERRARDFLVQMSAIEVALDDCADMFANLNQPEDLTAHDRAQVAL